MNRITEVNILSKFTSSLDESVCGIYWAKFNGENKLFIENNGEIGVVSHLLGENPTYCVNLIREDVAQELRQEIIEIEKNT